MKLRQPSTAPHLLLLSILSLTHTFLFEREVASSAEGIELAKEASHASLPSTSQPPALPVVNGVGTSLAPVDGKDGKPHSGPWVETDAERDRKKAQESGLPKPAKETGKSASSEDGWSLPETNNGVMDDPHRTGPKEGTRGTEGGISEKTKDGKEDKKESIEKKPDPPKEAPPLPHGEQKSLEKQAGEDEKKSKEAISQDGDKKKEDGKKDEKAKELGGLEVSCPG